MLQQLPASAVAPDATPSPFKDVSLFRATLSQPETALPDFFSWLSDAEKARVEKMTSDSGKRKTLVSRALLRWVLSRLSGVAPDAIVLARGEHGRPFSSLPQTLIRDFNVAHTGENWVCAVTTGNSSFSRIGIDIESPGTRKRNVARLSERVLTPAERETLLLDDPGADEAFQTERFLRYWTLKEAFSKAVGRGITMPFSGMEFEWDDGVAPRATRLPDEYDAKRWRFAFASEEPIIALAVGGCTE